MEDAERMIEEVRRDTESDAPPGGLEEAKEVMLFVDRAQGSGMAVTLFESEDAMKRGDEALNSMNPGGSACAAQPSSSTSSRSRRSA